MPEAYMVNRREVHGLLDRQKEKTVFLVFVNTKHNQSSKLLLCPQLRPRMTLTTQLRKISNLYVGGRQEIG